MTVPIKRGTARRLGLRRPGEVVEIWVDGRYHGSMSRELYDEAAEFRSVVQAWIDEHRPPSG